MKLDLPPFASEFTPSFGEFLKAINGSLLLSSYQTGKVICLSPTGNAGVKTLTRTFDWPTGIASESDSLAIATKYQVIKFKNSRELAANYPPKKDCYDALFVPRTTYHVGRLALHDMTFTQHGLVAVNTSFSCLCTFDEQFSFTPIWQPPWISELAHEDRCHLNGMATSLDGQIKFVTSLSMDDSMEGWRNDRLKSGILWDVLNNTTVLENLCVPHSPRIFENRCYFLNSGKGELVSVDFNGHNKKVICRFNGFPRGMQIIKGYAVIATSKQRDHAMIDMRSISGNESTCAINIVHLDSGAIVGALNFLNSCTEIYDLVIIPDSVRPNILRTDQELLLKCVTMPGSTFWANL